MFDQFKLNERLQKSLTRLNLSKPTTVQEKAIPLAMLGKDLFVTAPTGTGKTLSFVLPLLHCLLESTKPGKGLQALIILPTRELASQIYKTMQQMASHTFFEALLVTGGEGLQEQAAKLRKNPDIIIGTPGRLVEHWKKQQLQLDRLKILVLDETDRILDMGFGEDVNTLIENCPITKQTLLFSATKGDEALQLLIDKLLSNPTEIHLNTNEVHRSISQQVIFADMPVHKIRITEWLLANEPFQKVIIFTNTRLQADQLSHTFTATQIKHAVLHSEKSADERKQITSRLNQNHKTILIATDIAARGLDIPHLDLVINFDIPNTADEYTHRIGRTGRMYDIGLAISLVTQADWKSYLTIQKAQNNLIEKRIIPQLTGKFQGTHPEQTKRKKPTEHKVTAVKKTDTNNPKVKRNQSTVVSTDGFAPLKRKK